MFFVSEINNELVKFQLQIIKINDKDKVILEKLNILMTSHKNGCAIFGFSEFKKNINFFRISCCIITNIIPVQIIHI